MRIDQGHRQGGRCQLAGQAQFQAAGGFQHDLDGSQAAEPLDQSSNHPGGIGHRPPGNRQ